MTARRSTTIQTLRLRAAPGVETRSNRTALRLRASAWLRMARLHPPGLPPAAILHVRRLPDPMPFASGSTSSFRPPPAWQQALRSALDKALRAARTPVQGRVPGSAEAVVFANPAEQRACLLLDLARGVAATRWWWQPVFATHAGAIGTSRSIPSPALTQEPRELPGAMAFLAEWNALSAVLEAVDASDAPAVLSAVAAAYGVSVSASSLSGTVPTGRPDAPPGEVPGKARTPWSTAVDRAVPKHLSPAVRALAATGLELVRRPHRAPRLIREVVRFHHNATRTPPTANPDEPPAAPAPAHAPDHAFALEREQERGKWTEFAAPSPPDTAGSPTAEGSEGDIAPGPNGRAASPKHRPQPQETNKARDPKTDERNHATDPSGASASERAPSAAPPDSPSATTPERSAAAIGNGDVTEDSADETGEAERRVPRGGVSQKQSPELEGGQRQGPSEKTDARSRNDAPSARDAAADDQPAGSAGAAGAAAPRGEETSRDRAESPGDEDRPTDIHSGSDSPEKAVADPFGIPMDTWVRGSRLGGFVYILNLLNALGWTGLPGAGDIGTRVRGEAGPWGVLEAVVRALLGDDLRAYADDPLWAALARLDGREEGAIAGADLSAFVAYVAPPDAVAQCGGPGAEIRWFSDRGRLRVWSARLLLADVPVEPATPRAVVAERADALGARFQQANPDATAVTPADGPDPWHDIRPLPGMSPVLRQWTRRAMPLVRYRLREALGRGEDTPLRDVLAGEATLHLTPMHVDVTLPLEAVSLAVRVAGLDRDPGWLPDFGRVVHLHFS